MQIEQGPDTIERVAQFSIFYFNMLSVSAESTSMHNIKNHRNQLVKNQIANLDDAN